MTSLFSKTAEGEVNRLAAQPLNLMYNFIMSLVLISLAFLSGIIFTSIYTLPAQIWFGAGLALLFLIVLFQLLTRQPKVSASIFYEALPAMHYGYFLALVFFFFGAARYEYQKPNFDDPFFIAFYNDRAYDVLVTGTLDEPPDYRDQYTNLRINVEAVDSGSGDLPARGLILARVLPNETYEYGQRVRARGQLKTPPENEDFSYRDYLARAGIYSRMSSAEVTLLPGEGGNIFFKFVYWMRNSLLENIYKIYHDPEASLLAGILLGVDTGLTKDLQNAFKNTGTAHIIAISGFNIAIIGQLFFYTLKNIGGEKFGAFSAIIAILFYTLLVGADSAVTRAAIMGSVSLFARQIGRRNNGLNGLAFAVLGMLIFNPLSLWDVGFQLSALATLGLVLYAEPFSNFTANLLARFMKHDISAFTRFINDNIVLTFAAQLTTIPIMAYHFKRISLISFVANPFILPVQPAVMVFGGLTAFVSLVSLPLGQFLAWFSAPFPIYTIRIVEFFDSVPNGIYILKDSSLWAVIATYAALFSLTSGWDSIAKWIHSRSASLRAVTVTLIFTILFICSIMLWRATATAGEGQLRVTFLDVGSANAVLVQTPEGRNILINGGASVSELSDKLGRRLPFFTKKLDWLIIASTHEDEISALPRVLERYPPENVLRSGNMQASYAAQTLDKFFAKEEIPVTRAELGQKLTVGEDLFIEVISVSGRGSVLLIQYNEFRALLPIGLDVNTYEFLESEDLLKPVNILLLADSGYAPSNPIDVIKQLNPQLIVVSVEAGDKNGLPDEATLESLEEYSLLRTDRSGWISVITDGINMRVEVGRGNITPTPTP